MADELHVGADFLAALRSYAQDADDAVQEAVSLGMSHLANSVQEAAARSDRWKEAAVHIEAWADDGRLWLGVRNTPSVSEAQAAEYGDPLHPPVPMLRNTARFEREANQIANSYYDQRMGVR